MLTKPIGTGILAQAIKQGGLGETDLAAVVTSMTTLNKGAKDAALASGVRAATDITGFGLLGHLHHLALASRCAARLFADAVPTFDAARASAEAGLVPGGTKRNLQYVEPVTRFDPAIREVERLVLADAQTSGGLLLAVAPENEAALLAELAKRGTPARATVGELIPGEAGHIEVVAGDDRP